MSEQARKELFNEFDRLSYKLKLLGAIVQNPVDNLSSNDVVNFIIETTSFRQDFNELALKTKVFLSDSVNK